MRRMSWILAGLASCAASSCVTMKSNETVCPEHRSMRCATAPECSMDYGRGCRVCQCGPAAKGREGGLPSGVPPDQRR